MSSACRAAFQADGSLVPVWRSRSGASVSHPPVFDGAAARAVVSPRGVVRGYRECYNFAHRARAAGWSLEEIAYYLGHTTKRGTPALQTTVRYTQASREQVRDKLRLLEG